MPRLRTVSRGDAPPDVLEVYDQVFPGQEPTDFWTTFALAPDILKLTRRGIRMVLREGRELPPRLRELALVRTGLVSDSRFVYSQHSKGARRAGIPEEKIAAIKAWASAGAGWAGTPIFTDEERAVLAYVDDMLVRNHVEDSTFGALKRFLNERQILELTYVVSLYHLYARVVRVLRLEFDDVPDRMIEVPAEERTASIGHAAGQSVQLAGGEVTMESTVVKRSISSAAARRIIEGAEAKATQLGVPMVISVVDESGVLKAFSRMDGAPLLSVDISKDKAYTAVAFGLPTHEWFNFIKEDPPLLNGITKVPRLIVFGGGYPIKVEGQIIGGIGVSGGHYTQDMEVAQAGLAALTAGSWSANGAGAAHGLPVTPTVEHGGIRH